MEEESTYQLPDDVYVVVPAYNEGRVVAGVVRDLRRICRNVVVTDDGSRDDTYEQAASAGAHLVRHLINRGQGAALQTGITFALSQGARIVVTYDADGQHDIKDMPALIAPIEAGTADIVLGSRFIDGKSKVPLRRKFLLFAATLFTRIMTGLKITDTHNGYRALSRSAALRIDLHLDRMAHASEILDQIKATQLRYVEVPVHVRYTTYSRAKGQSALGAVRILIDYVTKRYLM